MSTSEQRSCERSVGSKWNLLPEGILMVSDLFKRSLDASGLRVNLNLDYCLESAQVIVSGIPTEDEKKIVTILINCYKEVIALGQEALRNDDSSDGESNTIEKNQNKRLILKRSVFGTDETLQSTAVAPHCLDNFTYRSIWEVKDAVWDEVISEDECKLIGNLTGCKLVVELIDDRRLILIGGPSREANDRAKSKLDVLRKYFLLDVPQDSHVFYTEEVEHFEIRINLLSDVKKNMAETTMIDTVRCPGAEWDAKQLFQNSYTARCCAFKPASQRYHLIKGEKLVPVTPEENIQGYLPFWEGYAFKERVAVNPVVLTPVAVQQMWVPEESSQDEYVFAGEIRTPIVPYEERFKAIAKWREYLPSPEEFCEQRAREEAMYQGDMIGDEGWFVPTRPAPSPTGATLRRLLKPELSPLTPVLPVEAFDALRLGRSPPLPKTPLIRTGYTLQPLSGMFSMNVGQSGESPLSSGNSRIHPALANISNARPRPIRTNEQALPAPERSPPTIPQESEVRSRKFYRTMNQGKPRQMMGNEKKSGRLDYFSPSTPVFPSRAVVPNDPTLDFVKDTTKALEPTINAMRNFKGEAYLEAQFGRILLKNIPKLSISIGAFQATLDSQRLAELGLGVGIKNKEYGHASANFTNLLSAVPGDIKYIMELTDEKEERIWTTQRCTYSVTYQVACYDCENGTPYLVEIDAATFVFSVKSLPITFGNLYVHCTMRNWDFCVVTTGVKNMGVEYGAVGQEIVDSLSISAASGRVRSMSFNISQGLQVAVSSIRVQRNTQNLSVDGKSILSITEVNDMFVEKKILDGPISGNEPYQAPSSGKVLYHGFSDDTIQTPPGQIWFEVGILSVAVQEMFKTNKNVEFGEEVDWVYEDLLKEGALMAVYEPACKMVKEMDGVGYYNDRCPRFRESDIVVSEPGPALFNRYDTRDDSYW